ncbi:hypothetical protein Acy02nite_22980 [Actinoplanes cyaneus]|uniref:Uncharacterized protein n=1 Tax=Actinoplanes cyaneus TaxID=52696 RepID=A0A919M3D3_9ACTN|nr:hypothetical protein Acy02nite_22980 [Actinoplanes cyaneus]
MFPFTGVVPVGSVMTLVLRSRRRLAYFAGSVLKIHGRPPDRYPTVRAGTHEFAPSTMAGIRKAVRSRYAETDSYIGF